MIDVESSHNNSNDNDDNNNPMLLKKKVQETCTCVYKVRHALASSSARKNASVNTSHAKTTIPVTGRGGPWVVRRRGSRVLSTICSQLTGRYWLLVAVLTVHFVLHRKHTASP
jgi:hypothetical protein